MLFLQQFLLKVYKNKSYIKIGGDGQDYTFHGKQWVSNKTGQIAKRDVAHILFKQFLP